MFPLDIAPSGSILLSLMLLVPLLGGVVLFFVPAADTRLARTIAFVFTLLNLLLSLILFTRFQVGRESFQFVEKVAWLPKLGVNYTVGVDGLSIWLIMLTTFLSVIVVAASGSVQKNIRAYLGCLLFLEVGMLGTFFALDGITFYIFWEMMLIPMYFLIGVWGGARRVYAAIKFVLYTALGSLLMLVAIVYLAHLSGVQSGTGELSFYLGDWERLTFEGNLHYWLFGAFALAFAIKVPVFPLHTWLPDAHTEAPTGGSVILAGVLLKMGLYGLIRFGVPIFPEATAAAAPIFAVLAVIGIVYGALVAWVQTDMKKLVAYSSVSHLGFCVLGYAAMNFEGMQGCVLQMLNHGISTSALFLLVGVLYDRKHSRLISDYGGLVQKVPVFSAVFLVFTLSSIGLPLTNGFVGEFLILLGGFRYNVLLGAIAVSGVVFGAMYMLSLYRRVIFGAFSEEKNGDLQDLTFVEGAIFAPLLVFVFWIGLYPGFFLRVIEPASLKAVSYVENMTRKDKTVEVGRQFATGLAVKQGQS